MKGPRSLLASVAQVVMGAIVAEPPQIPTLPTVQVEPTPTNRHQRRRAAKLKRAKRP